LTPEAPPTPISHSVGCVECGEPPPYHGFCCPESLPPRSLWNRRDPDLLFGSAATAVIPFRQSGFAKSFDRELVTGRLGTHPEAAELERLDPRELLATQSGLQRPALEHYLGIAYRQIGRPYAEPHSPGNKYPLVYRYEVPSDGRLEAMILAGHHRSAAALLQGHAVLVRVVDGPVRANGARQCGG
jgi:hypothetical protein